MFYEIIGEFDVDNFHGIKHSKVRWIEEKEIVQFLEKAVIAFNVACLSIIWDMKGIINVKFLFYIICKGMLLSSSTMNFNVAGGTQ